MAGVAGRSGASHAQKARLITELRAQFSLDDLLAAAELARSTYYYQRKVLDTPDKRAPLKSLIQSIQEQHKGRYGYRRITAALRNEGWTVDGKTVLRLMNELGLKCTVRERKYKSYRGPVGLAAANTLDRQFVAEQPNQKWVTDVTEFKVGSQKLYLSPVLDLYNGEIVAYQLDDRPRYALVGRMLEKALARLPVDAAPLLHSDQGWHYRYPAYRESLVKRGLEQSMSRKGNCLDNAAMESFFGTLKTEFFYRERFESIAELWAKLVEYIDYYNNHRIKLKLGGLSPVAYRTQAAVA